MEQIFSDIWNATFTGRATATVRVAERCLYYWHVRSPADSKRLVVTGRVRYVRRQVLKLATDRTVPRLTTGWANTDFQTRVH